MIAARRSTPGSAEERRAAGREARRALSRSSHAKLGPADGRDPLAVLESSNEGRIEQLVPVRHGRMATSSFAFFRGTASIMAADLGRAPSTSLQVQLCGDCHLANFGLYATPERTLVFDLNDFDETARGPFEWDLKRLATSAVLAARTNGHSDVNAHLAGSAVALGYREAMATFAGDGPLTTWYRKLPAKLLRKRAGSEGDPARRVVEQMIAKAQRKTGAAALPKLTTMVDGNHRFDTPPEVRQQVEEASDFVRACLMSYRRSLAPEIRALYDRYDVLDLALRVVGVGSVGLGAWILLLEADDERLILQLKEARASVLEVYCGALAQPHAGQRVVVGQRTMQSASDLFLGWLKTPDGQHYYVRQLQDMKGSAPLDQLDPDVLTAYSRLCGAVLARAHACSGDALAICAYLGNRPVFDEAIAEYAEAYADLAEHDFAAFTAAIASGRLAAVPDERGR